MKRLRAFVSGKVQMTGYRARVASLANFLGLVGFVQNLPDGRVKVVAEGEESILGRFLDNLRINDPLIDVQDIEVDYTNALGDFVRFEKMVGNGETDQRLDKAAELLSELIVVNKQIVGQLIVNNEVLKDVREEAKGSRQDIRAVHEEVKGVREEIKESTHNISQKITSSSELIAEKIDDAREEISAEVKELHTELRDDLREKLIRIEGDVSQIKARIGL